MTAPALTIADVAARLGVSNDTVRAWVATRELTAVNVAKRAGAKLPRWRITEAALEAFIAARSTSQPAPATPRRRRRDTAGVIQFFK